MTTVSNCFINMAIIEVVRDTTSCSKCYQIYCIIKYNNETYNGKEVIGLLTYLQWEGERLQRQTNPSTSFSFFNAGIFFASSLILAIWLGGKNQWTSPHDFILWYETHGFHDILILLQSNGHI